jgi:hypothetical protein
MAFHWLMQKIAVDVDTNEIIWEAERQKKNKAGKPTGEMEPDLISVPPGTGETMLTKLPQKPWTIKVGNPPAQKQVLFRWRIITREHDVGHWIDRSKVGRRDMLWAPNPGGIKTKVG